MTQVATRKRFTVAEFDRMAEAGVLAEDERVELIRGELITMNPIGARHAWCVDDLTDLLARGLGTAARVSVQNPVVLDDDSAPQPDLAVLRRRRHRRDQRPGVADMLLLVEVADTSLAYDRDEKVPLYAQAGVPEVWLVDLMHTQVVIYTDPAPDGYRSVGVLRPGDSISLAAFPDHVFTVADFLE